MAFHLPNEHLYMRLTLLKPAAHRIWHFSPEGMTLVALIRLQASSRISSSALLGGAVVQGFSSHVGYGSCHAAVNLEVAAQTKSPEAVYPSAQTSFLVYALSR